MASNSEFQICLYNSRRVLSCQSTFGDTIRHLTFVSFPLPSRPAPESAPISPSLSTPSRPHQLTRLHFTFLGPPHFAPLGLASLLHLLRTPLSASCLPIPRPGRRSNLVASYPFSLAAVCFIATFPSLTCISPATRRLLLRLLLLLLLSRPAEPSPSRFCPSLASNPP